MRMEGIAPKIHDDHIAGKGEQSTASLQFGTQIYSYAPSNEDTCSQSSSGQRMGKTWENYGVELAKVRNKSDVINEARNKGVEIHFASLMDLGRLKKCWITEETPEV